MSTIESVSPRLTTAGLKSPILHPNRLRDTIHQIEMQITQTSREPLKSPKINHSLEIISIATLDELSPQMLETAVKTYQTAFAQEPYCEYFSQEDVISALRYLLDRKGDLIFGKNEKGDVMSLAGGYPLNANTYFIEELAVSANQQGKGYGRQTFNKLVEMINKDYTRLAIRTMERNSTALKLYTSSGFVLDDRLETVYQMRQNGSIALDTRVHLSRPALSIKERLEQLMNLKHLAIAYPSGNTTAVIFDQLLNSDRKKLNQSVMDAWKKQKPHDHEIEQCCFVSLPQDPKAVAKVEMFGGEFCGNATRSVIWLITKGQDSEGLIEVSGVSHPLEFNVKNGEVTLEMPLPSNGNLIEVVEEGTLVHLDGITHLVVTDKHINLEPRQLFEQLKASNKYNCTSYPAFGVSYINPETGKAQFCVWVKAVDTVFDETACGSGTCSIGIALATATLQESQDVIQPSGKVIRTSVKFDVSGSIIKSSIAGGVDVLHDGEFKLA